MATKRTFGILISRCPLVAFSVQFVILLGYFSQLAQSTYFVSNPSCGLVSSGFLQFEQSLAYEYLRPLGVCDWGYDTVLPSPAGLSGTIDLCLQCLFVPASESHCPAGYTKSSLDETWDLVPEGGCQLTSGCLDVTCPQNSLPYGQSNICPGGNQVLSCCPYVSYVMCCQSLTCSSEQEPSGNCIPLNSPQDLQPGQALEVTKYAVPQALTCPSTLFSFTTLLTCMEDSTFSTPLYYDSCTVLPPPNLDSQGCPVVPGYTFMPNQMLGKRIHAQPDVR
jgi:hypothetical protein